MWAHGLPPERHHGLQQDREAVGAAVAHGILDGPHEALRERMVARVRSRQGSLSRGAVNGQENLPALSSHLPGNNGGAGRRGDIASG